jgi:hypothetical protein
LCVALSLISFCPPPPSSIYTDTTHNPPCTASTGIPESPTLVFALVGLILLPPVLALGLDPRRLNAPLEVGPLGDGSPRLRGQVGTYIHTYKLLGGWWIVCLCVCVCGLGVGRWVE